MNTESRGKHVDPSVSTLFLEECSNGELDDLAAALCVSVVKMFVPLRRECERWTRLRLLGSSRPVSPRIGNAAARRPSNSSKARCDSTPAAGHASGARRRLSGSSPLRRRDRPLPGRAGDCARRRRSARLSRARASDRRRLRERLARVRVALALDPAQHATPRIRRPDLGRLRHRRPPAAHLRRAGTRRRHHARPLRQDPGRAA